MQALAFSDPAAFWEQDWGAAWLVYYGQDAINVDPVCVSCLCLCLCLCLRLRLHLRLLLCLCLRPRLRLRV